MQDVVINSPTLFEPLYYLPFHLYIPMIYIICIVPLSCLQILHADDVCMHKMFSRPSLTIHILSHTLLHKLSIHSLAHTHLHNLSIHTIIHTLFLNIHPPILPLIHPLYIPPQTYADDARMYKMLGMGEAKLKVTNTPSTTPLAITFSIHL